MKIFFLFLAFSIFVQAREVCVPGSCQAKKENEDTLTCSADTSGKKSCCSKLPVDKNDHSDDNSCDGDSCHCLGCLKVCITSPSLSFEYIEWYTRPGKKNTVRPVDFYLFDYTKDFYHPPRLLS